MGSVTVGGTGGNGGVGVQFTAAGASFTNSGMVTGGNGGLAGAAGSIGVAGSPGAGGAGIVGGGLAITNSGTISGGFANAGSGAQANAITFTGGSNSLTLAPGYSISGNVVGTGTDTFQLGGSGSATFDLSTIGAAQQYQGFSTFNVVGGTWTVSNTFGQAQTWNVNGGTLAGTGTLPAVNVNAGGTLQPGTPGTPGTAMTITGNLAFVSGALYLVQVNPTTASLANVGGTATLSGGAVNAQFASGSYVSKQYTILTATGGLGGTTFSGLTDTNLPAGFTDSLSYNTDDVFLNLSAALGAGTSLNQNQQNVATALNSYFNRVGTLPPNFVSIFGLTGGALANALTQIDGEAATGAEQAAFQLTNEFLNLMLDPFANGRGNLGGGSGSGPVLGFAPDQQASLPPDIALAYDEVFKAPPKQQNFDQRWSAWGTAYGGASNTNGDPGVGSNNLSAQTYGYAAGMDYHFSPYAVAGFALAGGGTSWGLSNALGTGYSQAFQFGGYGIEWFGPAYLAGALSFTNNWFTTNRTALGDQLRANFAGQSYGGRFEGGYRYAVLPTLGVTPYGAVQFQDFQTPSYSEADLTGGRFGLSYAAMNATDVRTELGARFDDPTLLYGKPLILFARLAWAHDFVSNPALSAAFESLPGTSFTVNGAPIPHDSALTTAGLQYFLRANWSIIASFDGEFAPGSETYGGSGTLRYTW